MKKKLARSMAVLVASLMLSFSIFQSYSVPVQASSYTGEALREVQEKIARGYYNLGDKIVDKINSIKDSFDSLNMGAYIKHTYGTTGYEQWKNGLVPYGNTIWTKPINYNTGATHGGGGRQRGDTSNSDEVNVYDDDSSTSRHSTIVHNTTYNSDDDTYNYSMNWYNPVTNNYVTSNEWNYYNTYNTYVTNYNNCDYYITNNYSYVSYTIVPEGSTGSATGNTIYYEIYYELSDGRNSVDLTVEDIWGIFFVYDVVNYQNVPEDDGSTLGLWHFNGDLKDSSHWSNSVGEQYTIAFNNVGYLNGCKPFTSTDDYVKLPLNNANFDMTQPFTVEWFQYTSSIQDSVNNSVLVSSKQIGTTTTTTNGVEYSIPVYERHYTNGRFYYTDIVDRLTLAEYTPIYEQFVSYALQYDGSKYSLFVNGKHSNDFENFDNIGFINICNDYIFFDCGQIKTLDSTESYFPHPDQYYGASKYFHDYTINGNNVVYSQDCLIDELRLSKGCLYSDNYTPTSQEYVTNMVLALPSEAEETDIAIKSQYPVSNYRIGGVKPTYPEDGTVYIMESDNVVQSVQQYQSNGWYEVTGAIYIDGEWQELQGYDLSVCSVGTDDDGTDGTTDDTVSGGDVDVDLDDDGLFDGLLGNLLKLFTQIIEFVIKFFVKGLEIITVGFTAIIDLLNSTVDSIGGLGELLATFFPFVPEEFFTIILGTISVLCGIAVYRALRG